MAMIMMSASLQLALMVCFAVYADRASSQTTNPRIVEHPEDQYVAKNEPATLTCRAEGHPSPTIKWYKGGEPVITSENDLSSHIMLIPSGQLFFLKVLNVNKSLTDVGVYHCVATNPETKESVRSRNATLDISYIREDFRDQPKNTDVALGGDVELPCQPPRGRPEPRLAWKKDQEVIVATDRVGMDEYGNLRIRDARTSDTGFYSCVAYNSAGERESPSAKLAVREKPKIIEGPKDTTVLEHSDALFKCRTGGGVGETVIWRKSNGQRPTGRFHILDDRSLKISKVEVSDAGTYACRVENSVGSQEAEARLTVHTQPSFLVTPQDLVVGVGRQARFRCQVIGIPMPAVFWNKDSSDNLMFPSYDNGRFSVTEEGTLIIDSVSKSDEGEYVCKGLSIAGNAFAMARLTVKDTDFRPPPVIRQGPLNQTLPMGTMGSMPCLASGDPPPSIKWYKNGREVVPREPRVKILDIGTLKISELRKSDSGTYTCKASSETGETTKSGVLQVEPQTDPSVVFHRTPEPSTFPGPPSKPVPSDIMETSVRLAWKPNPNPGSSPITNFIIEYFSHEVEEGWVVASDSVTSTNHVVNGLRPDTTYMFMVRSQNSHGVSLPSPIVAQVKTKGAGNANSRYHFSNLDPSVVSEKLSAQIINLLNPETFNSTAIKVMWEVRRNVRFIEGFHVKYRPVIDQINNHGQDFEDFPPNPEFAILTIQNPSATSCIVSRLIPYTWYEVKVQPYQGNIQGMDSGPMRVRTMEGAPSSPPDNIQVTLLPNNTLVISWDPPPKVERRGQLKGYKIWLLGNESKHDVETVVNASMTHVSMRNVMAEMNYKVQVAAYTRVGDGVRSDPISVGHGALKLHSPGLLQQPWFVGTLIATVGGVMFFLLSLFCCYIYKRNSRQDKLTKNGTVSVSVQRIENPVGLGYPLQALVLSNGNQQHQQQQQQQTTSYYVNHVINTPPDLTKQALLNPNNVVLMNYPLNPLDYFQSGEYTNGYISDEKAGRIFDPAYSPLQFEQNNRLRLESFPSSGGTLKKTIPEYFIHKSPNAPHYDRPHNSSSLGSTDSAKTSAIYQQFLPPNHPLVNNPQAMQRRHQEPMLFIPPPPQQPPPNDDTLPTRNHHGSNPIENKSISGARAQTAIKLVSPHPVRHFVSIATIMEPEPHLTAPSGKSHKPSSLNQLQELHGHHYSDNEISNISSALRANYPGKNLIDKLDSAPLSPAPGGMVGNHGNFQRSNIKEPYDIRFSRIKQMNTVNEMRNFEASDPIDRLGRVDPEVGHALLGCEGTYEGLADSDLDTNLLRECPSPVSSVDDMDRAVADSVCASWNNAIEEKEDEEEDEEVADSDTSNSDDKNSRSSTSSDGSFLAKDDFTSAVARAAELSGIKMGGASNNNNNNSVNGEFGKEKIKKPAKFRQRATRPQSPYSTDSNYSSICPSHRPHKRRKTPENGKQQPSLAGTNKTNVACNRRKTSDQSTKSTGDQFNSSGFFSTGNQQTSPASIPTSDHFRVNPLEAFDTKDTPIV